MNNDQSSDHLVLGGLLFLVFSLVVALVFVYTRAGDTESGTAPTTTAVITNEAPVVDSVNIGYVDNGDLSASAGDIALTLGGQTQVVVWGTVSDANGEGDIDAIDLVLRRSGAVNADSCTADLNDCYKASNADPSCVITGDTATTKHYACTVNLEFFADGTTAGGQYEAENWVANVTVADLTPTTGTGSATTEVGALLGLNIPTAIAYGQFALGATSSASASVSGNGSNVILDIDQRGNVIADVTVQTAAAMSCDALGNIPVANQKWALAADGYDAATSLTTSSVGTGIAVQYQTDDNYVANPSRKNLFWYIGIPTTGVRGTCTGTNTISIVAAQ